MHQVRCPLPPCVFHYVGQRGSMQPHERKETLVSQRNLLSCSNKYVISTTYRLEHARGFRCTCTVLHQMVTCRKVAVSSYDQNKLHWSSELRRLPQLLFSQVSGSPTSDRYKVACSIGIYVHLFCDFAYNWGKLPRTFFPAYCAASNFVLGRNCKWR